MNPAAASQITLDNALVPPEARLKIGECNRRIKFSKPQREATYQVTLDALKLNNKRFRVDAEVFRDILQICPKLFDQPFNIPPSTDEEIMSFIYGLRYTRNIETLPELVVDHMHQTWRTFVTVINRCISGKNTRLDILRSTITSQREPCPILDSQRSSSITSSNKIVSPKEPTKKPVKAKKDVSQTMKLATKPKPIKKKASVKADKGKGVLDEQQRKILSTDEGTGTKLGVPDVPKYDYESEKESWGDSGEEDNDDEDDSLT
ncbi:hypothetical protein Tco_1157457 [Tanacetum coccineum]